MPIFEANYRDTFTKVRTCRKSADHDLQSIVIWTNPLSTATYENRDAPFPIGTLIVKEQYDFSDPDCMGSIVQWTAAIKTRDSDDVLTDHLGFTWQRVRADRTVDTQDDSRCYGCHKDCTDPTMNGFHYMCSQPP